MSSEQEIDKNSEISDDDIFGVEKKSEENSNKNSEEFSEEIQDKISDEVPDEIPDDISSEVVQSESENDTVIDEEEISKELDEDQESEPQDNSESDDIVIEFEDKTTKKDDDLPEELTSTDDIDPASINSTLNNPNFDSEQYLDIFTPKEISSLVHSSTLQIFVSALSKSPMEVDQALKKGVEIVDKSIREENIAKYFQSYAENNGHDESVYERSKRIAIKRAKESEG